MTTTLLTKQKKAEFVYKITTNQPPKIVNLQLENTLHLQFKVFGESIRLDKLCERDYLKEVKKLKDKC